MLLKFNMTEVKEKKEKWKKKKFSSHQNGLCVLQVKSTKPRTEDTQNKPTPDTPPSLSLRHNLVSHFSSHPSCKL